MEDTGKTELAHPHDRLVRNILADADLAADLLQHYLAPEWVSALEWGSLKREPGEAVKPNLSTLMGDLRYSTRFKGSNEALEVFVFFEHQSRPDRFMSFRMLEYVCAAYGQQLPALKKGMRFPYPLTVVLHHGKMPWKTISPMRDLIATPPDMAGDILNLPICLIDLAAIPVDQLRGHPMVRALLDSLQSASAGTLPSRIQGILARLRGLSKEQRVNAWATALVRYYASIQGRIQDSVDELASIFVGLYSKKEAGKMAMTIAEALQQEGMAKGIAQGKIESMITVLETRFGEAPATLQKKLRRLQDADRIEEMLKLAATCQNLKDFQKAL